MTVKNQRSFCVLFALALLLGACNFRDPNDVPPTLAPRISEVPLPTIGYSTLEPGVFPTAVQLSTPSFVNRLFSLTDQVDSQRLMAHVNALQGFYTRHVRSTRTESDRGIGAAYTYILGQFEQIQAESNASFTVFPQPFALPSLNLSGLNNIVGIMNGTEAGAGVILIGAHYDSRNADPDDGSGYAPGANDNGSGVAALIEIARIMSQTRHSASIIFVAFSAEEIGRLGSNTFVREYVQLNNIPLTAMIDLDIIGSSTAADGSINDRQIRLFSQGPDNSGSRQLARAIEFINFNYSFDMTIVNQELDDRPGSFGDHMSFSAAGYAAVRFTEMNEEPQKRHTERDTVDDVQPDYLARATRCILTAMSVLADGPRPPRNLILRDNPDGTRRLVWEDAPGAASYLVTVRAVGSAVYQEIPVTANYLDWDGFVPHRYSSVAVVALNAAGLIGPPSPEYAILN